MSGFNDYDEGGSMTIFRNFILCSVLLFLLLIGSRLTPSTQWIGERQIADTTIEVTRWSKQSQPKAWELPTERQLKRLLEEIRPDSKAQFYTGNGVFFRREPWGEIVSEEKVDGNAFILQVKEEKLKNLLTKR